MLAMAPKTIPKKAMHIFVTTIMSSCNLVLIYVAARIHKYVLCRPALSFPLSIQRMTLLHVHVLKNEEIQDSAALFRAEQMFRP
jgi:hypothetical protein